MESTQTINKVDLKVFADLFHQDFDHVYKENSMGFSIDGYISDSFAGLILRVEETPVFETKISELSDDEICDIFKKHTGRNIENSSAFRENFKDRDIRGFTENGWYLFKGLEFYKWNKYTALKDLSDINEAILKAGRDAA